MSARWLGVVPAALVLVAVAACDEDLQEVVPGCEFTEECMPGTVCKLPEGACVPTPTDAVVGHFACTVHDTSSTSSDTGQTDVTGLLGDRRTNLLESTDCTLDTSGAQPFLQVTITADAYQTDPRLRVIFRLPVQAAPEGGFALKSVRSQADILGAYINEYTDSDPHTGTAGSDLNIAYARTGIVILDGSIEMAAPDLAVSGYVEVHFVASAEAATAGAPCPNGPSDCGPDPRAACDGAGASATCALTCEPMDTCPGNGACVNGVCTPP